MAWTSNLVDEACRCALRLVFSEQSNRRRVQYFRMCLRVIEWHFEGKIGKIVSSWCVSRAVLMLRHYVRDGKNWIWKSMTTGSNGSDWERVRKVESFVGQ